MRLSRIEAVVAVANNGTIGRSDTLPWHLKSDLKRFRKITLGNGMLMGRKTYESIGKPLPGRTTFVMSRQPNLAIPGCQVVQSYQEALEHLPNQRLFVVGGAEIYRQLFPVCRAVHLTRVLAEVSGDARLESIDLNGFRCSEQLYLPASVHDDWPTLYELWETTEPTIDS